MRDKPDSKEIPERLKAWWRRARARGHGSLGKWLNHPGLKKLGSSLKNKVPGKLRGLDFDLKGIELKKITEVSGQYSGWIRWSLIALALFLLASLTSGIIGLFIRPTYLPAPRKSAPQASRPAIPTEDYDAILRRNMFNVEGKIPDPFDQGLLDCFSQARPSTQRLALLGTIVMNDERHSVALVQDEVSSTKIAVKKEDLFSDGKYLAMKVERKKLCFQVRASQDFEFLEIPEENVGLGGGGPAITGGITTEGITPIGETEFAVKKDYLEKNLLNLNEILQTARAVPYVEPGTGKFRGFLVQSIDPGSPFQVLGIRQGDILTGVNDIILDNAGKGLEAFQRLRNSPKISLEVIRGGSKTVLNYDVK